MAMTIRSRIRGELDKVHGATAAARLVLGTIRACLRYRVTGLASEAAFFMLLSLPPLVLGLFGGVGFVGDWLGTNAVSHVTYAIREYAARFLTEDGITPGAAPDGRRRLPRRALRPPVHRLPAGLVVRIPRPQRLRHTISIMYGQSGVRGIVRTRALSFSLYLIALVSGVLIIPLVLIGPAMLDGWLPERVRFLGLLYWPVVVAATVAALTTLFHIATPQRARWWRDVPGAVLALLIWVLASFVLRGLVSASLGGTSIYGPLSAPIVLLIWLYALAIAVLVGAGLNSASRVVWPVESRVASSARLVSWARHEVERRRSPLDYGMALDTNWSRSTCSTQRMQDPAWTKSSSPRTSSSSPRHGRDRTGPGCPVLATLGPKGPIGRPEDADVPPEGEPSGAGPGFGNVRGIR